MSNSQPGGHAHPRPFARTKTSALAIDTCPHCGAPCEDDLDPDSTFDAELPPLPKSEVCRQAAEDARELQDVGGDFEILRELGRGGMGVVYLARQRSLKRNIALKVLSPEGAGRGEALGRFQREAEAVARLQHPDIVHVFQIGEWHGQPFLALEYVDGGTLADYLGGIPCPPGDAAALLETVARAVHFAHRHEIVHRDLKPANILLAARESRPAAANRQPLSAFTPKVSDFGLAKEVGTQSGQSYAGLVLGTPSYMAPEQARGETECIGPAADVYALGAILYEMLTGRPPFRGASSWDTVQQVVKDEPLPPARLQPATPRDLETICMKCLRKEPGKRYESADALADDLQRFRERRPISARPVGSAERLWRWARRNPGRAVLSAALLLVFLAGSAGVLWQWHRAEHEKVSARKERDKAEASLRVANATIHGFVDLVDHLDRPQRFYLSQIDFHPEVLKALLARAQEAIERDRDRADRRVELADAYQLAALLRARLLRASEGLPDARAALAIRQALVHEQPGVIDYERDVAACHQLLGYLYHAEGKGQSPEHSRAGLPDTETALMIRKSIFEREPTILEYRSDLANCYNSLGLLHVGMRDYAKAAEYLVRAIEHQEVAYSAAPQIARYRMNLSNHYFNLANCYIELGRVTEALAAGRRCRDIDPTEPEYMVRNVRILSRASGLIGNGKVALSPGELALRERYADEAMALLREAINKGFSNVEFVHTHTSLDPLRTRDDFKKLWEEMLDTWLHPRPKED